MMEKPEVVAGLVAVLILLAEVIKYGIQHLIPMKAPVTKEEEKQRDTTRANVRALVDEMTKHRAETAKLCEVLESTKANTDKLYDLHNRFDEDGVPVWFVPRSWSVVLQQAVEQLRINSELQRRTLELVERIERRVEKIQGPDKG